ncbi:MAG: hypothetical protein QOH61_2800, partial [Chloroflexota bacterium]|nr:hypothetical protein [Chloroflexota bacterium]
MVLPNSRPYAESAASLARILSAVAPPAPVDAASPGPVEPAAPPQARRLPLLVAALLVGALSVAVLSPTGHITAHPVLLIALVAFAVVLDVMRIDVFERANVSPASVPILALAFVFGPLGPIAAEGVIALTRLLRRQSLVGLLADFGMLSITGAATAGVWIALAPSSHAAVLGGGAVAGITSYAVNALLMLTLMSLGARVSPLALWREGWAWLWPHYLAFGALAGGLVLAERAIGGYGLVLFALPIVLLWLGERQYISRSRASVAELRANRDELEVANRSLRALVDEKQALVARMQRSYLSTITSLAR